jgi:hypothetical protein
MGITEPSAASKSRRAAAMENKGEVWLPENEQDAVTMAVRDILRAAKTLCAAADLAGEGIAIDHYINSAIRLRDLADSLSPDKPEWPANVIQFMPRRSC